MVRGALRKLPEWITQHHNLMVFEATVLPKRKKLKGLRSSTIRETALPMLDILVIGACPLMNEIPSGLQYPRNLDTEVAFNRTLSCLRSLDFQRVKRVETFMFESLVDTRQGRSRVKRNRTCSSNIEIEQERATKRASTIVFHSLLVRRPYVEQSHVKVLNIEKLHSKGISINDSMKVLVKTHSNKYDVFWSVSSEDTHKTNFTSHLDSALRRNGITTYCYAGPETGDQILPQVFEAIQESKLYLVFFSKHYAISSRCHNELKHILQTSETRGQFVVSVYYDVDPAFVREQLAESAVVLSNAASLATWDSNSIRPDSKLIEEIVGDIIKKLNRISPCNDIGDLVGIPDRLNHFKCLLDCDSQKLCIIGIFGSGGIGKTTLAKVLFDKFSIQFEASCFVDGREAWKSGRKKYLQNKIVPGMLGKKVLIVIDDVEEVEHFDLLVGDRDRYESGSRIIITSRNSRVIEVVDTVYKMTELSFTEAILLFQLSAFKTSSFTDQLIELSKAMVDSFPKHNPLSLKIMGSSLYGKSSEAWVETLERLQKVSESKIQNVLRICYDQLEEVAKNAFLDIACFFKGADEDFTKRILEGCWSCSNTAIKDLLDKSLITTRDSKIWMQDILEDLGKKIIQEESVNEPGQRSRLWEPQDVYHVLKNNTGTEAVEAVFLDMCEIENVEVCPMVFSRMDKLRILKLHSYFANCTLQFTRGDLRYLPNELRYLHWDAYPFKSMPSGFNGNKLVELRMNSSKVEKLWEETQSLENLKAIDLSYSRKLIAIPDLSRAPNVETVSLRGCKSLVEVPQYFQFLEKLISLDLEDCSSLETVLALPENIIHVNVAHCNSLKILHSNISLLKSLRRLDLSGCSSFDSRDYEKFMM